MKKLLYILFILPLIVLGQAPHGINYQAVAYDSDGFELSNKEVGVRISIVEGSAFGMPQLVEEHDVVTTEQGLFSIIIGQGALLGGEVSSLLDISWGSNTYFLKIELDIENNGSYMDFGTQQFMSVPYALYAESSGTPGSPGEPADPVDYDSLANIISIDSTFLASVTGGIGGCDFLFPDGKDNITPINHWLIGSDYIVPPGKNLYITSLYQFGNGDILSINGTTTYIGEGLYNQSVSSHINQSILAQENDVIHSNASSHASFTGFLIDKKVDPLNFELLGTLTGGNITYTVPNGKILVVLNIHSAGQSLYADGHIIARGHINNYAGGQHMTLTTPLIFGVGQVLSSQSDGVVFNGYLADEDYFANCGGGSSSNETSSIDSTMVANMIAASGGSSNMAFGDFVDITSLINDNIPSSPEFQQTEDGFIYIYLNPTSLAKFFKLSVDSITPLGFDFMSMYGANKAYYTAQYAVTPIIFPIKKNYYWSFEAHEDLTVWKAFWIPLESTPASSNDSNSDNASAVSQYGDTLYLSSGNYLIIPGLSQSNLHWQFTEYGTVTDVDGNEYKTLLYGDKEWMVENLKTITSESLSPFDPNVQINFPDSIGRYYSAYEITSNICPNNWHVPTLDEWQDLHNEIFGTNINMNGFTNSEQGFENNNYDILFSDANFGTNQSFFNLFSSGKWINSSSLINGDEASFWTPNTNTCNDSKFAINFFTGENNPLYVSCTSAVNAKLQVRCVKD